MKRKNHVSKKENGRKKKKEVVDQSNNEVDYTSYGEIYNPEELSVAVLEDERDESEVTNGHSLSMLENADDFMQWLIAPCPLEEFKTNIWDRRPLLVSRSARLPKYYSGWHSIEDVKELLNKNLKYTTNVDARKYIDGKVHYMNRNDDGSTCTADPAVLWRRYSEEGCTIRVLHPQRWCERLHVMLAACERFWGCATGCNTYLTPPGTQGFPLHFDEIDAFVLQLEGRKTWKVWYVK